MGLLGVLGVILVVLACIQLIFTPVAGVTVGMAVVAVVIGLILIFFNYRGTGRV